MLSQRYLHQAEPCNGHNASAESEKDSLIQSGDQDEPSEPGAQINILPGKLTCPLKINGWKKLEDVFPIEIVSL